MIEIGRLCVKIAGRDAGKKAVIVDVLDNNYILLDGETRRRKCNILHIEPLEQKIDIKKNASHDEVAKALKELGIESRQTKPKPKTQKPKAKRKTPEQLRAQKEEKRKLRDLFKFKKKEEKVEAQKPSLAPPSVEKKETTLEEKAGLAEEKKEIEKTEAKETKHLKKENKAKTEKPKNVSKKEDKK